jgi:hypothetical protein
VVVSVFIESGQVRLDPKTVGAGTIELIIANAAREPQRVVLTAGGGEPVIRTSPISSGESGKAQADVEPGTYTLRTTPAGDTATLRVGPRRPSSNDDLITP